MSTRPAVRLAFASAIVALAATLGACRCSLNSETPGATGPTTRAPSTYEPPADALVRPSARTIGTRRTLPGISPRVLEAMQLAADAGTADGS